MNETIKEQMGEKGRERQMTQPKQTRMYFVFLFHVASGPRLELLSFEHTMKEESTSPSVCELTGNVLAST